MKISLFLLKTFIETPLKQDEIAELLTDIGLEVEGMSTFSSVKGGLKGLVVGEVIESAKHPNADKLKLTKVNIGNGDPLQIVCGAPNVEKGQKVVVATVGSTIYPVEGEPFEIKKAKIRGEHSFGMICAEDEIGIGTNHDGIMVLADHAMPGESVDNLIPVFEDTILEIGLTPNRADAMSHLGVARDLYAALKARGKDARLLPEDIEDLEVKSNQQSIEIHIDDKQACPVYSGLIFENVKVEASPKWLQNQLKTLGVKPINNIVDITNLILKEYGQPLHAFDASKISGDKVVIRKAKKDEKITTLDEKERTLHTDDLLICDAEKPMCIAGVFGGNNSGVKEGTTQIFLESAYFSPSGIRKTAQRHGLHTDAAQRYEKGADPDITVKALQRAAYLFKSIASAEIKGNINHQAPNLPAPFPVKLRLERLANLLGIKIEKKQVKNILEYLEIKIESEKENEFEVLVPPAKVDVTREVDVIEEIARIYGYNQIPETEMLTMHLPAQLKQDEDVLYNHLANQLSDIGFFELNTNSISREVYYDDDDQQLVKIIKSANAELNVLRKDLLHNALEVIAYNKNRQNHNLRFFELGKSYSKDDEIYQEIKQFTLWATGMTHNGNWRQKAEKADFYYLKSMLEKVLHFSGADEFTAESFDNEVFSNGLLYKLKNFELAKLGKLTSTVLSKFDLSGDIWLAEIDWDYLKGFYKSKSLVYKEVSRFPMVDRDLALLIDKGITYEEIKQAALKRVSSIVSEINLFDIYSGKGIPENKLSYAIRIIFRHPEKTLTDKEVDKEMKKIIANLEKEVNAEIRK